MMQSHKFKKYIYLAVFILALPLTQARAQLTPQLADVKHPVKALFKAPNVILGNSVKNLYGNTLNMSIYHTFGLVNTGINGFYGLDTGANIRLGLDYGITDRLSVGLGRTRIGKVVDARFKYSLLHQMKKDRNGPVELALAGDWAITTAPRPFNGNYTVGDRMNFMLQAMAARKMSDRLSLQLAPTFAHYNRVYPGEHNNLVGIGLAGRYKLTGHTALALEYIPVFKKNPGTYNTVAVALNMETGGHVFQLFFTNSQAINQQDLLRNTQNDFWAGNFSFGFNINRIFWFKDKPE